MSNSEPTVLPDGLRQRLNTSNELDCNEGSENSAYRPEFATAVCTAPTFHVPADSRNSFYAGQGPAPYQEYADRYSMGYQRMGQTITLTSHKIQFGCQGGPSAHYPYGGQRYDDPCYRAQYALPLPPGKAWPEPSIERPPSSNSKSNNRGRTTYTDEQIAELERVFNSNPYPTSQTRQHLAYKIDVPEGKVKIWFQNRRARAKKSKLGCGPWRPSHNDSRVAEDRTNQNNNNAKENVKISSTEPSISISSILPLPTKTSINTSWSNSSYMNPMRSSVDASRRSSARNPCTSAYQPPFADRGRCHCRSEGCCNRDWSSGAPGARSIPQSYRGNYGLDSSDGGHTSGWNMNGMFGSVPDLINQTSKVDINEGNTSMTEPDMKIEGEGPSRRPWQDQPDRCVTAPLLNIPTPFSAPLVCQDRHNGFMANELSSPPPIRRLIFPFHTLTEGNKVPRPESAMVGALSYPATAVGDIYPRSGYQSYSGYQNASSDHGNKVSAESYHTFGYTKPEPTSDFPLRFQDNNEPQGPNNKWPDGEASAMKFIPEIREKQSTGSENDGPNVQPNCEDDEATDDAIDDDLAMNDNIQNDDLEQRGGIYRYAAGGVPQEYSADGWRNRTSTNILAKAMEVAEDGEFEEKDCANDMSVNRLSNINPDINQTGDSTGVWPTQFVTGIYPPVSASMVG